MEETFPPLVAKTVRTLDGLIAESEKGARLFLRRLVPDFFQEKDLPIALLNEHTPKGDLDCLLEPILKGERWGLVSDCGLPCVADPGADLVYLAHKKGLKVEAYVGPSSLVLALMLSGLPAQSFSFQGYLPRDVPSLIAQIALLEKRSFKEKMTFLFIEAPYRNEKLFSFLLQHLAESTALCVAWDLTLPTQQVHTLPVAVWKKRGVPSFHKKPAVFLLHAFK